MACIVHARCNQRERVISVSLCVLNDISTSDLPLTSYPLFGIIMRSLSKVKMPIVCQAGFHLKMFHTFPSLHLLIFAMLSQYNFAAAWRKTHVLLMTPNTHTHNKKQVTLPGIGISKDRLPSSANKLKASQFPICKNGTTAPDIPVVIKRSQDCQGNRFIRKTTIFKTHGHLEKKPTSLEVTKWLVSHHGLNYFCWRLLATLTWNLLAVYFENMQQPLIKLIANEVVKIVFWLGSLAFHFSLLFFDQVINLQFGDTFCCSCQRCCILFPHTAE